MTGITWTAPAAAALVVIGVGGQKKGPDPIVGTWVTSYRVQGRQNTEEATFRADGGYTAWTSVRDGARRVSTTMYGSWKRQDAGRVRFRVQRIATSFRGFSAAEKKLAEAQYEKSRPNSSRSSTGNRRGA